MRLPRASTFTLLSVLVASCGGGASENDVDYDALIQSGEFDAAQAVIETRLAAVEKGTDEHKELVIGLSAALAEASPVESKAEFLAFAKANESLVSPRDFRFVVDNLRTYDHFETAVGVMHEGKVRWPEDPTMDAVLKALENDIAKAGDEGASEMLRGLGYAN